MNGLSWGAANLAAESLRLFRHYMSVAVVFAVQAIDLRAAATFGHFDGRGLLGPLARQLYESVYDSWGRTPGKEKPLVFDDADQVLDVELEKVHDSLLNGESSVACDRSCFGFSPPSENLGSEAGNEYRRASGFDSQLVSRKTALVYDTGQWTYAELDGLSQGAAQELLKLGVGRVIAWPFCCRTNPRLWSGITLCFELGPWRFR